MDTFTNYLLLPEFVAMAYILFRERFKENNWKPTLSFAIAAMLLFFMDLLVLGNNGDEIKIFLICILWTLISLNGKVLDRAVCGLMVYAIVYFIDCVSKYINWLIVGNEPINSMLRDEIMLIENVIIIILILIAVMFRRSHTTHFAFSNWAMIAIALSSVVFSGAILLIRLGHKYSREFDFLNVAVGVCLMLMMVASFVLLAMDASRRRKNNDISAMNRHIETMGFYMSEMEKNEASIRKYRHDINEHLKVIARMAADEKNLRILNYIQQSQADLYHGGRRFFHSGNRVADAIIAEMTLRAEEKGLKINCSGMLEEKSALSDYELNTVLSNLLMNAIEHCDRNEGQTIELKMMDDKDLFNIAIVNYVNENITVENSFKRSSKGDNKEHGLGLIKVRDTVEAHGGQLDFRKVNNKIIASIVILK